MLLGSTSLRLSLAGAALVALLPPGLAAAADTDWNVGTGNWSVDGNWTANAPNAGTTNTNVTNGGVAQIDSAADAGATLNIGNSSRVDLLTGGSLTAGAINIDNAQLRLNGSTALTTTGSGIAMSNNAVLFVRTDGTLSSPFAFTVGTSTIWADAGVTLTLNGALDLNHAGATLAFGTIQDTGTVVLDGSTATVSATASLQVVNGTLRAGTGATALGLLTAGAQTTDVATGAFLDLNDNNVQINSLTGQGTVQTGTSAATVLTTVNGNFGGAITGSGKLLQAAGGTTILYGISTYSGGTTINATGTLQLGNGAANGAIDGNVVNNGILAFDNTGLTLFTGDVSGSGTVKQISSGELQLTGTNTYGGGTVISDGTLSVSADGNLGNAAGGITFDTTTTGTLRYLAGFTSARPITFTTSGTIDTNGFDATLSGMLSGAGGFTKAGTGTLTLSGSGNYTGATVIDAGTLLVNGAFGSTASTTVNSGATLGGTGTVGNLSVTSGGTLSPGNSIGTLNVTGTVGFAAGSTYHVEVSPSASDRTVATGVATINGGTVEIQAQSGTYTAKSYPIVTASSVVGSGFASLNVSGSFGSLVTNPHLSYDSQNVYFVLDALSLMTLFPSGLNQNQSNVAQAIDHFYSAGGDVSPIAALLSLSGTAQANALTQASGESATGMPQAGFQSMAAFLGAMLDPFVTGRVDAPFGPATAFAPEHDRMGPARAAYAAVMPVKALPAVEARRWSSWATAYGGSARIDGDAVVGSHDTDTRAYGIAAGLDFRPAPDLVAGFALAGGATRWGLSDSLGDGRSDVFQAGLYASKRYGALYVSAAGAYAWHDVTTNRTVTIGATETLQGRFDAQSVGGRLEGGYRFDAANVGLTPYAALQAIGVRTPGYAETATSGAGAFALSYGSHTATDARTELGSWVDHVSRLDGGNTLTWRGRAAWVHGFGSDRFLNATFETLPGTSFTVNGAAPDADRALVSAAVDLKLVSGIALGAKLDGEFAGGTQSYAAAGSLRYVW